MVRLGHFGGTLGDINSLRGGSATTNVLAAASMLTRYAQYETDFAASPANSALLDGIFAAVSGFQSALGSFPSALQQYAQATTIKMADQDSPLNQKTLQAALTLLYNQMTGGVAHIAASSVAVGAQTAVGTPNGTPSIVVAAKNNQGLIPQTVFPETLTFTCTADSQGSATLGQEPMSVTGPAAVSDPLSYLWPGGSGVNTTLSAIDATLNNSGGNILQNSGFEVFTTANTPDNWNPLIGVAGTDIFAASSGNAYTGSSALQFTGTGSALDDSVCQVFNTPPNSGLGLGGTSYKLRPLTVYAVNAWIKVSATPTAGVLEFALTDGANPGTAINDPQGNANLKTFDLTSGGLNVSTTYVPISAVFVTPAVMPAKIALRVRLSTAIDSAKSVFVDSLAMAPMSQLYGFGSPMCSIFSGATKPIAGDQWTATITNTYGGFAKLFERLFSMRSLGIQLPYSGGTAVNDNLIA
jgi:hypothetical protein